MDSINYDKASPQQRREIRERYILYQKGLCWHCKSNIYEDPSNEVKNKSINLRLFPKHFFSWPIHLHHNHKTGMTIGAVHNKCNAVLWQYLGE